MKSQFSLLFSLCSYLLTAQVHFFQGSWQEARTAAQKNGKMLFVDVYADWCAPCKLMEKTTFPDPEVGRLLNRSFICYRMDAEATDAAVAKSFGVQHYPTYLFLNPDGSLFDRETGYMEPLPFRFIVQKTVEGAELAQKNGNSPSEDVFMNLSPELGAILLDMQAQQGKDNTPILERWLHKLPKDSLDLPVVEKAVVKHTKIFEGRAFDYLCRRSATSKRCAAKINQLLDAHCAEAIRNKDEKKLKTVLAATELSFGDNSDKIALKKGQMQGLYYLETQQPDDFVRFAQKFVPKQVLPALAKPASDIRNDWQAALDNVLWQYTEFVTTPAALNQALEWAQAGLDTVYSTASYGIAARLALKAGQKNAARTWLEKGITFAQTKQEDPVDLKQLLTQCK